MSYTLRQVQPLLTKPELELFQTSRAGAVKEITLARLAGKIQRSRALRDKYRDVYQRQTVQTRAGDAKGRKPLGGENTRTQTKADIMDEVLKRFEAQQAKLQRQQESAASPARKRSAQAPAAAAKKTAASGTTRRKTTKSPAGVDLPMRGASASTPRKRARQTREVQSAGEAVVKARSSEKAPAVRAAVKKVAAKKAPAKKAAATSAEAKVAAGIKRLQNIVKAVRKAVAETPPPAKTKAKKKPGAKSKAVDAAANAALEAAPTDTTPRTERLNPLKAKPVNKKIHASARSRTRATQAKRDAR
jgi:hypothetical protein